MPTSAASGRRSCRPETSARRPWLRTGPRPEACRGGSSCCPRPAHRGDVKAHAFVVAFEPLARAQRLGARGEGLAQARRVATGAHDLVAGRTLLDGGHFTSPI